LVFVGSSLSSTKTVTGTCPGFALDQWAMVPKHAASVGQFDDWSTMTE
jgi:hypothetical protein